MFFIIRHGPSLNTQERFGKTMNIFVIHDEKKEKKNKEPKK